MSSLVITNAGVQLMAKLAAGEATSTFTKLLLSSKQYSTGDLEGLTSLSDVKQEVTFSSINAVSTGTVKLTAVAENTSIKEGFTVNTLGLVTTDGTDEILYAVIDISGEPDFQPAYDAESVSRLSYAFTVQVGRAASVNLQVVAATTAMQISFDNESAKEFESENVQDAIVEAFTKKGDTLSYADSTLKLLSGETVLSEVTIEGGGISIDGEMSDASTNAVQNKVIKSYVDEAVAKIPIKVYQYISDGKLYNHYEKEA